MILRYKKFNEELFRNPFKKKEEDSSTSIPIKKEENSKGEREIKLKEWDEKWNSLDEGMLLDFFHEVYPNMMPSKYFSNLNVLKHKIRGADFWGKLEKWRKLKILEIESSIEKTFVLNVNNPSEKEKEKFNEVKDAINDCFQEIIDEIEGNLQYEVVNLKNPIINIRFKTYFMTRSECMSLYNSKIDNILKRLEDGYEVKKSLHPYYIGNDRYEREAAVIANKEYGFVYKNALFRNIQDKNTEIIITFINSYYEEFNYNV